MDPLRPYIARIRAAYPGLAVESARLHTTDGQFSDIVFVNEALVFRFPRFASVVAPLATETAALRAFQGRLPLPIPDPLYAAVDEAPGQAFMGYRLLPGVPLTRDAFIAISDDLKRDYIASQLGGFLQMLHTLAPSVLDVSLSLQDTRDEWDEMFTRFQRHLFPHMRPAARMDIARRFETFLGDDANFGYPHVIRHGDFGTANILHDPVSATITGIIDWSSVGLGDAAVDIAALLASYGEPFIHRLARHYPALDALLPCAEFYLSTFALQEALAGAENDDAEAFARGIAAYR